ncbi:hypothetical protein ACQPZZ_12320 [Microbispora sp. CA-135349]|uniref:hypothetical protein n=1 Tax=Microbispora sp. CA-135349 TaxID=3239953 RepID=UPI003D931C40
MTFPPDDEYGELLRRTLRAEADSVVPSPDGLEIIRRRIDHRGLRGLRGLLWWRIGAAAAGAVLTAGAVVALVPDLREQVGQQTGILDVRNEHKDEPTTSSVSRPPNVAPSLPEVVVPIAPSPSRARPAPSPTHKAGVTTRPSPSPSDPCVAPASEPGVIEPDTPLPPTCSPTSVTQPPTVTPTASTRPPTTRPTTARPTTAAPTATTQAPTPTETFTPNSATESPAS